MVSKKTPEKWWRPPLSLFLFFCVFTLPALDEIVAIPEMNALCRKAAKYEYDPKVAFGKTMNGMTSTTEHQTLLSGISVAIIKTDYLDQEKKPVISYYKVKPMEGMLSFPDSSGGRNTWLLKECSITMNDMESQELFDSLKIKDNFRR
ncbi:hypothetical protein AB835_11270 [Candidatus Endobugula sertula]|uniref:Uncharacterized protein n=1 Tax=Candidatus Endobugula sertula TaxID=62101 RepID=A0A1D2QN20_9GAMM|nr:hypothetical protein AB835_11270 [Candidatus Endobugula sertula]